MRGPELRSCLGVCVAVMVLAAGCSPGPAASPVSTFLPSVTSAPGTPTMATPAATAASLAASGHLIHVNLDVPLAAAAPVGTTCDAAALDATGPVAATIPGFGPAAPRLRPVGRATP